MLIRNLLEWKPWDWGVWLFMIIWSRHIILRILIVKLSTSWIEIVTSRSSQSKAEDCAIVHSRWGVWSLLIEFRINVGTIDSNRGVTITKNRNRDKRSNWTPSHNFVLFCFQSLVSYHTGSGHAQMHYFCSSSVVASSMCILTGRAFRSTGADTPLTFAFPSRVRHIERTPSFKFNVAWLLRLSNFFHFLANFPRTSNFQTTGFR